MAKINQLAWQYMVDFPGVVLDRGMIGSGKTATAFKLLEAIHQAHPERPVYVNMMDILKVFDMSKLLPDYIQYVDNVSGKAIPNGSVLLIDEAWFTMSSKVKHTDEKILALMDLLALSRQRGQTVIFIIQNFALLEKTSFRVGFSMINKYSPIDTIGTERPDMIDRLITIQEGIENRLAFHQGTMIQEVVHVTAPYSSLWDRQYRYQPDYNFGYYKIGLPSFWSDELSTFWSRYS